ncbi:50S ribosomal protein L35ae [Candidatus Thorarchaeota archaeon]|jgi:large subunit ribosomal protein L35Ae|nr:50S ribosomal protein L35ae [Candidatus Thorarchaeota archaeon]TFG97796.1 MAG: 50S ribosomal protein L35ae [Candidatus Thorarchaeota archaeon]
MSKSAVSTGQKGVVISYRRGKHLQHPNQVILVFSETKTRSQAAALVGRKVKWTTSGEKEILGKVLSAHGNSGAVRAKFNTNLPGQAIGTQVVLQ